MLLKREDLEAVEERTLAPYAMASRLSRGREYPEAEPAYRTAYQRDRDRIIHTTAFRRLEYKTQVFVNHEGDYYRTRLTHTLESAQIGRTVARALGANEDLVEAIALAHDLGHPPFGHSGEDALHQLMEGRGGFEHNSHSLRIVDVLEERYPGFKGLNLTWEVREGIIKHVTTYDRSDASGFEPDLRPTLEAQIVSAADEIAYNSHDLDDGLRAGMISPEDLSQIKLWKEAVQEVGEPFSERVRHGIVREIIGVQVTDLLSETERRIAEYDVHSLEDVRNAPESLVDFSVEMTAKRQELKDFLYTRLYRHYRVVRMAEKARHVVTGLFNAYLSQPDQLPFSVRARIDGEGAARAICDYIAGMTDRFALEENRKLFDPYERV
ncbi:MAG: deoxyguanosinetriphosphate triphosphohydrolase [Chloroflexi bacterium]|nr:deoxyguanosinetriphosphate triphosphohydrolase [Chloroflexota bacterium]